ncbi:hypothetical protein PQX77_005433 [Marasmius sp. AFHP31]|nr:hypothetical protein PQX77_005433 [Marasmius sp. AFHP31]
MAALSSSSSRTSGIVEAGGSERASHLKESSREHECTVSELEKGSTIVDLESWETDPDNARNWSSLKKWTTVFVIALYTLIPPLGSSMMAPGLPNITDIYGIHSKTITSLTLSVFLLSFAIGPLFLAPISEMYGRTWVFHIANIFSIAFSLGCAFAPSTNVLIAFRFLSGFSGAAPIACGGGTIGDLFSEGERGSAMAIYAMGPLIGPAVGPIAGGYLTEAFGIKWVFVTIAGMFSSPAIGGEPHAAQFTGACGVASLVGIPLLRETYAPVIRRHKAIRNGSPEKAFQQAGLLQDVGKWEYLWINLSRPIMLLCRSFICFVLSLYMAL